ncbi:hypothetical protein BLNAU_23847 [Blattamonas nauphoetae]|uniref:Uncharacterized protein n=1 Tax=Blattamonas nauphoetae TaxID=2049346 RepID=A0ABQ9WP39_9EUKA|nr:hypothetical protein BLNAU_23847 [Blattamonas nauphoetae]
MLKFALSGPQDPRVTQVSVSEPLSPPQVDISPQHHPPVLSSSSPRSPHLAFPQNIHWRIARSLEISNVRKSMLISFTTLLLLTVSFSLLTKYPEHKCFNPCGRTLLIISFLVPIALAIALFVPPHDDYAYQSSRFFQVIYCTCLTFTMVTSMKFAPFEAAFGLTLLVKIARRSGVMFALMFFSYLIVLFFTRPFLGEIVVFFKYLFNFSESFVGALHRITLILFIVFSIILSFRHTPTSSRFRIPRIVWRPVSLLFYPCYLLFMTLPISQTLTDINEASQRSYENSYTPYFGLTAHCFNLFYFLVAFLSRTVLLLLGLIQSRDWTVFSSNDISPSIFHVVLTHRNYLPALFYRDPSPSFVSIRMKRKNKPFFLPPAYFFSIPNFQFEGAPTDRDFISVFMQNGRGSFTSAIEYNTQPGSTFFLSGPHRIRGPKLQESPRMQRSRMRNRMELAGRASGRVSKVDGTDRSKVEENERQSINQTVLSSQIPSIPESLVICSGSSLGYLASLLVTMRRLQHLGQLSVRLRVIIWISNGRELSTLEVLRQTISEILDDPTPHTNTEILTDDTPLISRRHTTEYGEKGFVGASNDDSTPQKKEHEPTHLQNSLSTPLADSEAEFEVPSAHIPALAQQDDQISQAQLSTFSDSPSVKSRFLSQQSILPACRIHRIRPCGFYYLLEEGSTREVKQNKALRRLIPPGSYRHMFDSKLDEPLLNQLLDDKSRTDCFLVGEQAYEWNSILLDAGIKSRAIHVENLLM